MRQSRKGKHSRRQQTASWKEKGRLWHLLSPDWTDFSAAPRQLGVFDTLGLRLSLGWRRGLLYKLSTLAHFARHQAVWKYEIRAEADLSICIGRMPLKSACVCDWTVLLYVGNIDSIQKRQVMGQLCKTDYTSDSVIRLESLMSLVQTSNCFTV